MATDIEVLLDTSRQSVQAGKSPGLIRGLGVWAATAIVIGAIIGQSIFLMPSDVAREAGSSPKVLLVWLIGGVVVLFGALCYAELGAAMPEAGGEYVYLGRGLNPVLGFLFGWTSTMIIRPGSAAVIAVGALRFAGFLWPALASPIVTWHIWLPFQTQTYSWTLTIAQALAAALILTVTVLNYFGVRAAGRFQILLTAFKIALVVAIVMLGFIPTRTSGIPTANIATPAHGVIAAFLLALVPVMAAYNGYTLIGNLGGEIDEPHKNLPRAAIFGTLLVVTLYVLINAIFLHVLGFSRVAQSQQVASDTLVQLVGSGASRWFTVAMIVSAFGCLHSGLLTGPRVPYAMARDGNFFAFARRIQPRFHTPSGAVLFQGCAAMLMVMTGNYRELYSYMVFAVWTFFALTAIALIRLRVTMPELDRPYRVWGYPWTPAIFGAAAVAISVNLWVTSPVRSSIGLAIILLGVPFFYHWRRRAAPHPAPEQESSMAII
jgi:APA family basic amino acid/polyamine antiporter